MTAEERSELVVRATRALAATVRNLTQLGHELVIGNTSVHGFCPLLKPNKVISFEELSIRVAGSHVLAVFDPGEPVAADKIILVKNADVYAHQALNDLRKHMVLDDLARVV